MTRLRSSDRSPRSPDPSPDHVLLLRLWAEPAPDGGRTSCWRCSLEDPRTGQRRGFASVPDLVGYLVRRYADLEPT
jgi:hypothetical protein